MKKGEEKLKKGLKTKVKNDSGFSFMVFLIFMVNLSFY